MASTHTHTHTHTEGLPTATFFLGVQEAAKDRKGKMIISPGYLLCKGVLIQ